MTKDWVHRVGHFPVCQILFPIVVRAGTTSSSPAWADSVGMLSTVGMLTTPADFTFFNNCTAASTSLRRVGGRPLRLSLMDLHWPCDYTAQSSILSIGLRSRSSVRHFPE